MLTHNFLITKQSFDVTLSIGCLANSVSFSYQNISGMYPNPPHVVFVDSSPTATLTFAPFYNDFAGTCPTQGHFKTDQNLVPRLTISGLVYSPIPCTATLCSIGLDTSVKAIHSFYVYAYATGFAYKYSTLIRVNITCGSERVSTTKGTDIVFPTFELLESDQAGSALPLKLIKDLYSYFRSDKPQVCDITKFELLTEDGLAFTDSKISLWLVKDLSHAQA